MLPYSKYNLKDDLKITYLFGAGASYNSVPIWSEQAESMNQVAKTIKQALEDPITIFSKEILHSPNYNSFNSIETDFLKSLMDDLIFFASKAKDNGTIDSYAYILFHQKNFTELNRLKHVLSAYLDIWQFFILNMPFRVKNEYQFNPKQRIDTRYIQWLNLFVKTNNQGRIFKNENLNILTWNYDLQVELAFENLLTAKNIYCLDDINNEFLFLNAADRSDKLQIHHLNGHHGYFNYMNNFYTNAKGLLRKNYYQYLKNISQNELDFRKVRNIDSSYSAIKFSWENSLPNEVIEIAKTTDILVIIGYSFPQYNRKIDQQILNAVKANHPLYVHYQDPSQDISTLTNILGSDILQHSTSRSEFFIPSEFLFPP